MFRAKTAPALTRPGARVPFARLLSSRRPRCTVTSAPAEPRAGRRHDAQSPGQPRTAGRHGTDTANEISVDFEKTREAYKSKDSLELLRSLVVFKLCSYDFLVDKNKEVMRVLSDRASLDTNTGLFPAAGGSLW